MNANPEKGRKRWVGEVMAVMIALGVLVLFVLCWVAAVALCAGCAGKPASVTGRPHPNQKEESISPRVPPQPQERETEKLQEARAQVMEMPVLGTDRLLTSAATKPSFPKIRIVPLIFPPGTGSNLNWDVWESHDSKTWTVIERNIYPLNHCVWPTSSPSFYRIVGRQN
jgi:hypothetical protein